MVKMKKFLTVISLASLLFFGGVSVKDSLLPVPTVQAKTKYTKAKIKLPAGYTKSALLKAYQGKPSAKFIKASMKGMKENTFSRTNASESAKDNRTKINPNKLTKAQLQELTSFSLRLINQARTQLGLPKWVYSSGAQKLAKDIAKEYVANKRGINNGDHYVAGIVRACKKNGLNFDDNYVEDMAGYYEPRTKITMTTMKKNIYFALKQMIFGYTGPNEKAISKKSYYREWEHAGDLFNTQGSPHDGDYDYYGFSISKVGKVYSLHFIGVPHFAVNDPKYNLNFKVN